MALTRRSMTSADQRPRTLLARLLDHDPQRGDRELVRAVRAFVRGR